MKRFDFQLEALLKIRKMEAEQAQRALSEAIKRLSFAQKNLVIVQENLQQAFHTFPTKNNRFLINDLQFYQNYIDSLKGEIAKQQQIVQVAIAKRDECLDTFEKAAKKQKVVEKLKEKRIQEYQQEVLHEEQKMLDELASQVFVRQKQGDIE